MIELLNVDYMEYMATLPDKAFDLAVVDPPYGIGINVSMGRRRGDKKSSYHKFAGNDSNIPSEDYFLQLQRVSVNQIIWGGNYMADFLYPSPCWLLWDKGFSEDVTFAQFEMAWTSFKSSAKKYNYNAAKNNNRIHPTQKPVALYRWLLHNYATPGQTILDTHLGSGSSAIAAHQMGFSFVGCELDKDYYDAAVKRFNNAKMQQTLFK
jgi:site-specific DNA-methyltransferase (adenine-specific)